MRVSDILTKLKQIFRLLVHTHTPVPLILDSLRLRRRPYLARLRTGEAFYLEGQQGDWFTVYECCIRQDYLQHGIVLNPSDHVIDVGANFGAFAVLASRIVGPDGHVTAFEPSPKIYERLCRNLELNGCTNVTPLNEAASDQTGQLNFFVSTKSAYSSLSDEVDGRAGTSQEKITVSSRCFGDFLRDAGPVQLLKIDCEGGEYPIFASATAEDFATVDQVAMELHRIEGHDPNEIVEKIRSFGFQTKRTYPFVAFRSHRQ